MKTPAVEGLRTVLPPSPELIKSALLSASWAFPFLSILEKNEEVMMSCILISQGGPASSLRPNGSSL